MTSTTTANVENQKNAPLMAFSKPNTLLSSTEWENKQVQLQDPAAAQLFEDCRNTIVAMSTFIRERDQQYQEVALQMDQQIRGLQNDRRDLRSRVRTLEGQLETSQKTERVLQKALVQNKKENEAIKAALGYQAYQHQLLMAQFEVSQRRQQDMENSMEYQQSLLQRQTEKASLESRLNEKLQEHSALKAKLGRLEKELDDKSQGTGVFTGAAAGGIVGLATGGIGWAVTALGVAFGMTEVALKHSNNFRCTSDIHARIQDTQRKLKLAGEEIDRLNGLIRNLDENL